MRSRFLTIAMLGILALAAGNAQAEIMSGTFVAASPYRTSATEVAEWKANIESLQAGTLTSVVDYLPEEICLWKDGGGNWTNGNMAAIVTAVSGLAAGDIVKIDNNYFYRYSESDPWESYWDQAPYWVVAGSYTHTPGDTVNAWLIFGEDDGGSYTFNFGSGQYWLVGDGESDGQVPSDTIGYQMRLTREITVYSDATLLSPLTSGRGYTYSSSGITGGSVADYVSFDSGALTSVPEPATMTLLGLGLAGLVTARRRRR